MTWSRLKMRQNTWEMSLCRKVYPTYFTQVISRSSIPWENNVNSKFETKIESLDTCAKTLQTDNQVSIWKYGNSNLKIVYRLCEWNNFWSEYGTDSPRVLQKIWTFQKSNLSFFCTEIWVEVSLLLWQCRNFWFEPVRRVQWQS